MRVQRRRRKKHHYLQRNLKHIFKINCEHMTTLITWIAGRSRIGSFSAQIWGVWRVLRASATHSRRGKRGGGGTHCLQQSSTITTNSKHLFKLVIYFLKQNNRGEKKNKVRVFQKGYFLLFCKQRGRGKKKCVLFLCASQPNSLNSPLAIQVYLPQQWVPLISVPGQSQINI